MSRVNLEQALEKGAVGLRLSREEALVIAEARSPFEIHLLGKAARQNRCRRFGQRASYVFNLQINPSNLCEGGCKFCRFSARPGDPHAYLLSQDEIVEKVRMVQPTEVHIVGGLNHEWGYRRSLELVRQLRKQFSGLFIKAFTAVEMDWFARCEQIPVAEVLASFVEAGLNGMPGGGAEVFSLRIRKKYCPAKLDPAAWLEIHKLAGRLGLRTNATLLAGLGETPEEQTEHLMTLRAAQDEVGGFSSFIPLFFQAGGAGEQNLDPSPLEVLGLVAFSRLALDNIPHVKAYWPMIGLETAAAALSWGADDLDGTLGEERIAHAGGARTPKALVRERMRETIRLGGFVPVERDGSFMPMEEKPS